MSSRVTVRAQVVAALAAALRAHPTLQGVQILEGPDLAEPQQEEVLVGAELRGVEFGFRHMQAGRKQRQDRFEIPVWFRCLIPGRTAADRTARVETMISALDDVLATDPTLGGVPGLQWAQLVNLDGPDIVPTDEGPVGFAEARVEALTHLI